MKRKIYNELLAWKKTSCGHSALLVQGAHRVGKSRIVEEFARRDLIDFNALDERQIVSDGIYRKLLFDKLEVSPGMIMVNVVAQMLTSAGHKLYFYAASSRDDASSGVEIDFLIEKNRISRHNISP